MKPTDNEIDYLTIIKFETKGHSIKSGIYPSTLTNFCFENEDWVL